MADGTVGTSGASGASGASGGACGGEPDPSDSLRTFGAVVQALREHAGLTREEFGALVRFSKHTVASIELGRRMADSVFVENTAFSFILEEQLFLRRVGEAETTRELIDHVLEVAELRNVEIQVMPLSMEHAGLAGPMQLLETPENRWFAYCEGQESGQFIPDPKVVSTLKMRYARMRSQTLSLQDSLSLLQRMRGDL